MYKVLLVDDEYFLREALKHTISWEAYGCVICGEANNGVDGIQKARELQPDIILADVNMPIMNGLEMIEQLKEEMPDVLFCILTGYSEFEYARKGIELGVKDYMVKPVDDKALIETVQRLTGSLEQRDSRKQEYHSLRFWAEKNTESNKHSFLKMLLLEEDGILPEQFVYECESLHLPLLQGGYGVICMKADTRIGVGINHMGWVDKIGVLMEQEEIRWQYAFYYAGKGSMYLIFADVREKEWDPIRLRSLVQKIQKFFMQELNCAAAVGVGVYCKDYAGIARSRREAEALMAEPAGSELITKMLDYIHKNYADVDLSLREIAKMLYVNYSYLSTQFVKEVGVKASQYIVDYRMTKAADQLRKGNENMTEIALAVGYTDVKYFYRCFKKVFGMTPYQYKKMIEEK